MADTGVVAPTASESVSETPWSGTNATWLTPEAIYGAGEASVTAPQFDSPAQSWVLKAYTFDFSAIPDGSTIDGVQVVINARYAVAAVSLDLCQLLDTSRAKVGTNKYSTPQALTTSAANYTTGGAADKWGNALTAAWVKDADFGVAIGAVAGGANSDVFIDSVTMQVWYTAPAGSAHPYTGGQGVGAVTYGTADTKSAFDDYRQDILDAIVGDLNTSTSWNNVRGSIPVTAVVRTSNTVATITLPELAAYDIAANETLTVNINNRTVASKHSLIGSPTVVVTASAAGTAHPYTGAQGVGAISRSVQTVLAKGKSPTSSGVFARSAATEKARGKIPTVGGGYSLNASTVKARGRAPAVGGAQAYSAGTVKARGKVPVVGGGFSLNAATVKARGRVPTVGGSMSFSADAVYENATLYLYTAGGDQVYGAASEYSKTAGAAGTAFAYVGQGVIVFSDGSEHAIGRVYERGGAFHFAGGAVYSLSADLPSAYLYTGAGVYSFQSATERARGKVYDGAGAYSFQSGVVRIIGRVRFTSQEAVFVRSGGAEVSVEHSTERPELETKPLARSASHEALPTRPPGQDGFYTEPGQDGFYDEYPVDGFYADIGYFKEFKPFHRGASREAAPGRPAGQDGFYTEPGQDGFYDEYPAQGFYADIGYPKEFKPLRRATFTKEGKPS